MAARQNIPAQLRLKEIQIQSLKGISNCTITFPADRKVTAIMGMNGSGKSTIIHALACCYKPRNKTSKENNRFSDFFTPHDDNNWRDSGFTAHFYAGNLDNQGNKISFVPTAAPNDTFTQVYAKVSRWQPVYARRPVKESLYLGLQTLGTLSDDLAASRHAKYVSQSFEPANIKQKILESMCRVLEADYSDLMTCTTSSGYTFSKFTKNGITYTEHTMGAGEKRVFEVLKAAHDPLLRPNGLLLIDELDVLLHEKAFKKLIEELISIAEDALLEIVFSTHRESIVQFKRAINIVSIFNMGTGIQAFPGVSADALRSWRARTLYLSGKILTLCWREPSVNSTEKAVFRWKKRLRRNNRLSAAGPLGSVSRPMKLCGRQSVSTLSVQLKSCAASGSSAGILLYL